MARKLTDEKIQLLKELRAQKLPNKIIAEKLSVSPQTVFKWRRKLGLPRYPVMSRMTERTEKLIEYIRERGVVTFDELAMVYPMKQSLSTKLCHLVKQGEIKRVYLHRGGGGLGRALKVGSLLGDLTRKPLYYVDNSALIQFLIRKLELDKPMTTTKRKRFTWIFRRCLPHQVFMALYKVYASEMHLRRQESSSVGRVSVYGLACLGSERDGRVL